MSRLLCNVAVAVPLRTTFTYGVPAALAAEIKPGGRVLVPFKRKSLVGVVTDWVDERPPGSVLREIQKSLDLVPALTARLLELGQWISSYYVAPIGEVYRAMLPPLTELSASRRVILTDLGRSLPEDEFAASVANRASKPGFHLTRLFARVSRPPTSLRCSGVA